MSVPVQFHKVQKPPSPLLGAQIFCINAEVWRGSHSSSQDKFDTMFIISLTLLSVPVNIGSGTNIIFQPHILVPHSNLIIQSHIPV